MMALTLSLLIHALQASASRSAKRGLIYISSTSHPSDVDLFVSSSSDLTWYYNYGPSPSPPLSQTSLQFVPMLFGKDDDSSNDFLNTIKAQISSGANVTHVLAFNEPDGSTSTGGSSIAPDDAATLWQAQLGPLSKLGVKLGAPAVTGSPSGLAWLHDFFDACDGKCVADFTPVHWYGDFQGLASFVGEVQAAYPGEVWVTEFADPNVALQESQAFFNQSVQLFDGRANVTRYSYFGSFRSSASNVGPNVAMLDQNGKLTDIGSWYLGGNATGNIPEGSAMELRASRLWILGLVAASCWSFL